MNTRIEVLRFLIDTSAPDRTTVILHYASDEPAHPVWGGGVKQKHFSPETPTNALWPEIFGNTGVAYISWPDAPPTVAAWFTQQPGLSPYVGQEPNRFDITPREDAYDVARARASFHKYGSPQGLNKTVIAIPPEVLTRPINAPDLTAEQQQRRLQIRHVTFERHDVLAPWVATHITPRASPAPSPTVALPRGCSAVVSRTAGCILSSLQPVTPAPLGNRVGNGPPGNGWAV